MFCADGLLNSLLLSIFVVTSRCDADRKSRFLIYLLVLSDFAVVSRGKANGDADFSRFFLFPKLFDEAPPLLWCVTRSLYNRRSCQISCQISLHRAAMQPRQATSSCKANRKALRAKANLLGRYNTP